jgi:hypothetical protein
VSQKRISCENKNTAVYSNASYQYEYVSAKQDDSDNYENNTVYEMCDSHEIDNYENNTAYEMCNSREINFNTGNLPLYGYTDYFQFRHDVYCEWS